MDDKLKAHMSMLFVFVFTRSDAGLSVKKLNLHRSRHSVQVLVINIWFSELAASHLSDNTNNINVYYYSINNSNSSENTVSVRCAKYVYFKHSTHWNIRQVPISLKFHIELIKKNRIRKENVIKNPNRNNEYISSGFQLT